MMTLLAILLHILSMTTTLSGLALPQELAVDLNKVENPEDLGAWPPLLERAFKIQETPPVILSIVDVRKPAGVLKKEQHDLIDFVVEFAHDIDVHYTNKTEPILGSVKKKNPDPMSMTYWILEFDKRRFVQAQLTPELALKTLDELVKLFKRYGPVAFASVLGPKEFGWGFEVLSFNFPRLADSGPSTEVGCEETLGENGMVFSVCPEPAEVQTN